MPSIEQANSRTCAAGVISQSISYASGISTKRPQRVRPVPFVMDPSMTDSALAASAEVDALTLRTPVSRVEDPTYVPYDRQRAVVIAHHTPQSRHHPWLAYVLITATSILHCAKFGAVGAKMVTLRKYGDAYQKLFPSSAQVIITADPLRYWKPQSARVSDPYSPYTRSTKLPETIGEGGAPSSPQARRARSDLEPLGPEPPSENPDSCTVKRCENTYPNSAMLLLKLMFQAAQCLWRTSPLH